MHNTTNPTFDKLGKHCDLLIDLRAIFPAMIHSRRDLYSPIKGMQPSGQIETEI
jgi:hypothetical protein